MNKIWLKGLVSDLSFSYKVYGEDMYECYVSVKRLSGAIDRLHCVLTNKLAKSISDGQWVEIYGTIRTRNFDGEDGKRHMSVYVFPETITVLDHEENINEVTGYGYICRIGEKRTTPLTQRELIDLTIATHRNEIKSDYIPSIIWDGLAKQFADTPIGTKVDFIGRLQSRKYGKQVSEGVYEELTAYEMSVCKMQIEE